LKRALSASSKKWAFEIDDDGGMFDCSPEGIRMEGEGLQSSCRCAIAICFYTYKAILQRASGKEGRACSRETFEGLLGGGGQGYKELWPETWEAELEEKSLRSWCASRR